MPLNAFLAKLGTPVQRSGDNYLTRCPAHDDQKASLSAKENPDGKVLVNCFAGCTCEAILAAIGETPAILAPSQPLAPSPFKKHLVATYDYHDASGTLLYQVVRNEPKGFQQRHPDPAQIGHWIWNMKDVPRVPYRLPQLQGQTTVFIAEGEKDVEALWALGVPATTNEGGASKWKSAHTGALKAAGVTRVVLLPDNDPPGRKHMDAVAASMKAAGIGVTVLALPQVAVKGDVSDWIRGGGTRAALEALLSKQPYVLPKGTVTLSPSTALPDLFPYHFTDRGAAEDFRDRHADRVRFDHRQQAWYLWDGQRWQRDEMGAMMCLANEYARTLYREAGELSGISEKKTPLVAMALKLERRGPREAMLHFLQDFEGIAVRGDSWDLDPWLLGCPNGVVDLRTGVLRPGLPADMLTRQTGVAYDPEAPCQRWWTFLGEVFDGNDILVDYLWRALGYSLTGDMREQCWFLCHGAGANGKSRLLDTLEAVWGDYGVRANMSIFAAVGHDTDKFNLADLDGRRLGFAAEIKPGSKLNSDVLKAFTGGETMRAERKFGDPFTIKPVAKIWLGVNHLPRVTDDSFGNWRRVRHIPFLHRFEGAADDKQLGEKLLACLPGIQAWLVKGCLLWQERGLAPPPDVLAATEAYEIDQDPLAGFFDQCIRPAALDHFTKFAAMRAMYDKWATKEGVVERFRESNKALSAKFVKRGYEKRTVGGNIRFYGVDLVGVMEDLLDI